MKWLLLPLWLVLVSAAASTEDPTRKTVWVALLFCTFTAADAIWNGADNRARLSWTLAWLAYAVHVALAFHFYHHWSHAAAVQHVRERSSFGWGILASHLFTLAWTADVAWWWIAGASWARRPAWVGRLLYSYMAFIAFNATVVFETGFIRWAGVVVFLALSLLLLVRRKK
jgi:hypothetical protein